MTTTYYARVEYNYTGGDRIFTIPFSYIKKEHITVLINDEETTNFVFNSESQIQIEDTLTAGDKIVIARNTPIDERFVNFTNTSILSKENQNLSAQQTFDAVQEIYDNNTTFEININKEFEEYKEDLVNTMNVYQTHINEEFEDLVNTMNVYQININKEFEDLVDTMNVYQIKIDEEFEDLVDTISAYQILINEEYMAFTDAIEDIVDTFETTVNNEINALDTRVTAANTKAESAISTANTALSNSQNAILTANSANTKADNAVSTANTASTVATQANTKADSANTKADTAINTANTADAKVDEFGEDIEEVIEAAQKINELEEAVATAVQAADTAVTEAQIAVQQAQSISTSASQIEANRQAILAIPAYTNYEYNQTEAKGLADLKSWNRSTFDRSKFTVVGTPIITDDGIASGFSSSNCLRTSTIDFTKPWEIDIAFTVDGTSGDSALWGIEGSGWRNYIFHNLSNVQFSLTLSDDTNSNMVISHSLTANTVYVCKMLWTGTTYYLRLYNTDGALIDEKYYNSALTLKQTSGFVQIGYKNYAHKGSIDLKQFSITIDGVEIFNDNKTGIDQIKKDDYTIIGTPAITDDGIASGFSISNYIQTPTIDLSKPFEIKFYYNTGDSFNSSIPVFGASDGNYLRFRADSIQFILSELNLNNTAWTTVQTNTTYYVIYYWNGSEYGAKIYKPDGTLLANPKVNSATPCANSKITLGKSSWSSDYVHGFIDLNSFKIYVDGNLVYQPTLRIPYNQSKTGSKIVQSAYRDRVQDMYSQFGWSNYYTLSDTDFTVPMGENLNGHVAIVDWYRNGLTSWEYDTNLDCTQTGSCTSGTAVTLPKPFKDTNYSLSVSYSAKTATGFTPSASGEYIAKGKITLG